MDNLNKFRDVVKNISQNLYSNDSPDQRLHHAFDLHELYEKFPKIVKELFDDGHYSQATFEAYKFLEKIVQKKSSITDKIGKDLMMQAFNEAAPKISIADCGTQTGRSIQEGYKFLFAGAMMAIRNPRGHEVEVRDELHSCIDHLKIVSHLLKIIE